MADNAAALASACRRRPQLLHTVTFSPFAFSPSLPEPELLKSLSSAINVVHAGPRAAARALVPVDEALPLLLHASPAVRIKAAKLVAKLLGIPDELRARLTERSAAPFAAEPEQQQQQLLRPLGPPDSSAGIFQSSGLRGLDDERHPDLDADADDDDIDTDTAIMDASLSPEALGDELSLCTEAGVRWAASSASLAAASGGASGGLPPPRSSFVSIPHAEAALASLALALASQRPVLVSGAPGSGKSALVGELARRLGARDSLVVIHVDEQIDSKVLLGTYMCTEGAGEFAWQPGVVSQAVAHGRWLLLEDVDRAPLEVMASLAPLLEGGSLYLPGRATSLVPPPSFRLFATLSVHAARASAAAAVARSVYRPSSWQHVHVPAPSASDLRQIVAARFPLLAPSASLMVRTLFALVRDATSASASAAATSMADASLDTVRGQPPGPQHQGLEAMSDVPDGVRASALAIDQGAPQPGVEEDDPTETGLEGARGAFGGGRPLCSRDLLRWCARVSAALAGVGVSSLPPPSSAHLTAALRELVLVEALDIFTGALRKSAAQAAVSERLAHIWNVPPDRLHYLASLHKPALKMTPSALKVGRVSLPLSTAAKASLDSDDEGGLATSGTGAFAHTRQTLRLMERVAACVRMEEAVLLVGETGTGKTTAVQHLARSLGKVLLVHNLSEQSDSSELIGGFRPVQMRHIFVPLASRFEAAFCKTFSRTKNAALLDNLAQRLSQSDWKKLLQIMATTLRTVGPGLAAAGAAGAAGVAAAAAAAAAGAVVGAVNDSGSAMSTESSKRQRTASAVSPASAPTSGSSGGGVVPAELAAEWRDLAVEIARAQRQIEHPSEEGVAFSFVEGSLVRALREGHWLLLDEMNLASPETLERVAAVLEENGSVALTEKGEAHALRRHPDFRIFGAMNPPTDFGKKELPPGIRARFTELYVAPLTSDEDLQLVVLGLLKPVLPHPPVAAVVAFYQAAMAEAEATLLDGANQRPQFSLRTLCRALTYVAHALGSYGLERALWDGFHMTFVTQLQQRHQTVCEALILRHLLPKRSGGLAKPPPMGAPPKPSDGQHWVQFGGFWIQTDPRGRPMDDARYIVTPTIEARLQTVARMVAARRFPVLLQGPTSAGKTSMVERLARATGHRLVRINNHEHTDVQEYVGSFQPGSSGQLEFCDGALTQAVRHGYWIVLDELNLAPSEVLEALNRLLDDNRELLLPETGEVVRPHAHFMLFATQNPPGSYGGRKVLSRAFRNRFVQLQMDEIPTTELAQILEQRYVDCVDCDRVRPSAIELPLMALAGLGWLCPKDVIARALAG